MFGSEQPKPATREGKGYTQADIERQVEEAVDAVRLEVLQHAPQQPLLSHLPIAPSLSDAATAEESYPGAAPLAHVLDQAHRRRLVGSLSWLTDPLMFMLACLLV